jgi:hypothetical protein
MGDQHIAIPLPVQDNTDRQTSMPRVTLETTAPVFERVKTICALAHGATVTTNYQLTPWPESASELYRPSDRRLSEK